MSRIVPVPYQTLVRVFEMEGFAFVREKGDHMIFTKSGILRPLVLPRYDAVPVFIIKNLLRTARIDRERYFELLDRI
jgi:predicted RNA binding protein YcfA (HicA-like mRNA interferase family)